MAQAFWSKGNNELRLSMQFITDRAYIAQAEELWCMLNSKAEPRRVNEKNGNSRTTVIAWKIHAQFHPIFLYQKCLIPSIYIYFLSNATWIRNIFFTFNTRRKIHNLCVVIFHAPNCSKNMFESSFFFSCSLFFVLIFFRRTFRPFCTYDAFKFVAKFSSKTGGEKKAQIN